MPKIVNGVVVPDGGSAGATSSGSGSGSESGGTDDSITLFGRKVSRWGLIAGAFFAFLLLGFKGLLLLGLVAGVGYMSSGSSLTNSSSSSGSSSGSSRSGRMPQIRGMSDLPKTPARC